MTRLLAANENIRKEIEVNEEEARGYQKKIEKEEKKIVQLQELLEALISNEDDSILPEPDLTVGDIIQGPILSNLLL